MNVISKIKKLLGKLAQGDYNYILEVISWRLPRWLFYYNHSYLIGTDKPTLEVKKQDEFDIYFLTKQNSAILEKYGHARQLIDSRLAAGDKAVIIGRGDEIATLVWGTSCMRFHTLSGTIIDPGDNGAYYYGIYTKKDQRKKGLAVLAQRIIYDSYTAEGRYWVYVTINVLNKKSLNLALERMNCSILGDSIYIILFGISFCYYKKWPNPTKKIHIFFRRPARSLEWV